MHTTSGYKSPAVTPAGLMHVPVTLEAGPGWDGPRYDTRYDRFWMHDACVARTLSGGLLGFIPAESRVRPRVFNVYSTF
jgi:hypothetical protein